MCHDGQRADIVAGNHKLCSYKLFGFICRTLAIYRTDERGMMMHEVNVTDGNVGGRLYPEDEVSFL